MVNTAHAYPALGTPASGLVTLGAVRQAQDGNQLGEHQAQLPRLHSGRVRAQLTEPVGDERAVTGDGRLELVERVSAPANLLKRDQLVTVELEL